MRQSCQFQGGKSGKRHVWTEPNLFLCCAGHRLLALSSWHRARSLRANQLDDALAKADCDKTSGYPCIWYQAFSLTSSHLLKPPLSCHNGADYSMYSNVNVAPDVQMKRKKKKMLISSRTRPVRTRWKCDWFMIHLCCGPHCSNGFHQRAILTVKLDHIIPYTQEIDE